MSIKAEGRKGGEGYNILDLEVFDRIDVSKKIEIRGSKR